MSSLRIPPPTSSQRSNATAASAGLGRPDRVRCPSPLPLHDHAARITMAPGSSVSSIFHHLSHPPPFHTQIFECTKSDRSVMVFRCVKPLPTAVYNVFLKPASKYAAAPCIDLHNQPSQRCYKPEMMIGAPFLQLIRMIIAISDKRAV